MNVRKISLTGLIIGSSIFSLSATLKPQIFILGSNALNTKSVRRFPTVTIRVEKIKIPNKPFPYLYRGYGKNCMSVGKIYYNHELEKKN